MEYVDTIKNLQRLLKMEKEEDLAQYRQMVEQSSIAERVENGSCWYPVKITQTGYGRLEEAYVEVERVHRHQGEHQFQSGKQVSIFCNVQNNAGEWRCEGVIGSSTRDQLRIYLKTDELPEWISNGKIGVDVVFDDTTYKEMENALSILLKPEKRARDLAEILYGTKEARYKEVPPVAMPQLNASQQHAVSEVLAALDIAIIHGPPGTGKTTTLVQAIKASLQSQGQALVCAASNTAVDVVAERLHAAGIKVLRIGHPSRVEESLQQLTVDYQIANSSYASEIKSFRKRAGEYKSMAFKYKRNFGREEQQQKKLLLDEARSLQKEAQALEEQLLKKIIDEAQVIAATLVGANHYQLSGKRFPVVFIDEAGQALEPACWIPILKADKVVLAGDHLQLPPTVKSVEAGKQGFNETLFEKAIRKLPRNAMLQVQYRMHRDIMAFSSNKFYNGKLQAHASVENHRLDIEDARGPMEFVDTAGCGFSETMENKSLRNQEEAALLLKHLKHLLQQGGATLTSASIGIVSPYRAQVRCLQSLIAEDAFFKTYLDRMQISSVDGFQGQERDILYLSMVRCNERGEIGFLSDTRRMNVALTRARKKLVVIGDSATLASHPFYQDFLSYVESIQAHHSAWEWLYE
ncbi:MAG: AAA domain-containing protein [Cytophagaceae bacterium]|jgi:superfamily I DNA and/or RNA helicase|nr:AAA domain-containing protein [Cytophagaceae bacterium]